MTHRRYIPPHLRTGTEEQSACTRFWQSLGGIVYKTSDTRQVAASPGISDLLVVLPNRGLFVAWESKAGSEYYKPADARRLTDEQREFGAYLSRGLTTAFGFGDAVECQRWFLNYRAGKVS